MSIDWFEISRGRAVAEKEFSEMKADHVSKSELRAWCETNIINKPYMATLEDDFAQHAISRVLKAILERFCKEEV